MKFYSFEMVIEKGQEDDEYFAYSPTLPGCCTSGATIEETKKNMHEAIALFVVSLIQNGEPIPQRERLVHVEEVTIGLPEGSLCLE